MMGFWEIFWEHLVEVATVVWGVITGPAGIFVMACGIFFGLTVGLCVTWDYAMYTKLDTDSLAFRASYCARLGVGGMLYLLLGVATSACIELILLEEVPGAPIWVLLLFVAYAILAAYTAWGVHCNRARFTRDQCAAKEFRFEGLPPI